MAFVGLTAAGCVTVAGPGGAFHTKADQPLLYEQPGNVDGPVPTYAEFVFEGGIVPGHSVSARVFPRASVTFTFSRVLWQGLRQAYSMAVAPGVLAKWGRWAGEAEEKEASWLAVAVAAPDLAMEGAPCLQFRGALCVHMFALRVQV